MTGAAAIDAVMRALADPTRRAVYERVVGSDEITVAELTQGSGVTQGAVSQHLKSLKQAGLVADRPAGAERLLPRPANGARRPWSIGSRSTASSGASASPVSERF